MKKNIILLTTLLFLLAFSHTQAFSCTTKDTQDTSSICITDKSDFQKKNMGKFKYLDWTYQINTGASFLGKTKFHDAKGKFQSNGYTIKGEDIVNYYVSTFDFKNQNEAKQLFSNYVNDNTHTQYKNKLGTVYNLNDNSLVWLNRNVIVQIHANPDSPKKNDFLKKAFVVYSKKIPPQIINEPVQSYTLVEENTPTPNKRDISMDLKVNNSDEPITVPYNSKLDITWTSTGADICESSGSFMPKKNKSGAWAQGDRTLSTTGDISLLAASYQNKKSVYSPQLRIEIICSNNVGYKTYSSVRDSVLVNVSK